MNQNNFSAGSEWGIWDLQVQTILDDRYEQLKDYYTTYKSSEPGKWEQFIQKVGGEANALLYDSKEYVNNESIDKKTRYTNYIRATFSFIEIFRPELKLFAITDHNYYNDCLIDEFYKYCIVNNCKILCGVEINIGGIHLLVYFEKPPYKKEKFSDGIITFLSKVGIDNPHTNSILTVSSQSLLKVVIPEIINQDGVYIYPHCNSDNGLFQERTQTDRTHLADIYNFKSKILLQSNSKESINKILEYIKSNPALFKSKPIATIGSDSRSLRTIGTPDKDGNHLWIKSNPTFEGFRQIVYEPDERVRIQKESPDTDYRKSFFCNIDIEESFSVFQDEFKPQFSKTNIPLNKYMVAIIGGRGTGKSVLINYLANGFKLYLPPENSAFNPSLSFIVGWEKSSGEKEFIPLSSPQDLSFLYISQSEVKDKVKNAKELGEEIKKILNIDTLSFSLSVSEIVQSTLSEYKSAANWFNLKNEKGHLVNDKSFVNEELNRNQNLLDRVTTKDNKEKLTLYTENVSSIQNNENKISELNKLKIKLQSFKDEINSDIKKVNNQIPPVDFNPQIEKIDSIISELKADTVNKNSANEIIKSQFTDYKGDLSSLLTDVEAFKKQIVKLKQKLTEIKEREEKLKKILEQKNELGELIENELKNQQQKINASWNELLQGKSEWTDEQKDLINLIIEDREINIEGEIVFDKKEFYTGIQTYIDGRGFKNKSNLANLEKFFEVNSFESFISLTNSRLKNIIDGNPSCFYQDEKYDIEKYLFDLNSRSKYLYTQPKITYKNKTLDKLSAGQRGTLYLCMKLATKAFSEPIIFDQPEDDLDNEFIITELVDIFKKLKKFRQVIIVTHNANLVVNSDVEQVIIAQNNEEVLSYFAGALENPTVIENVCKILEGGKEAFERRKNKYKYIS
ncbi:MAG: hypothetical protein PHY57_08240 [Ignavibacterium sp.]|nr:hypothetical protein [Ignavibacterium sp.]